ncbi:MAG: HAD-IA family hydrolase [Alphaproteobacteria bacterium]|nr:HAD-IA family hydrolase [Alphaproteobacteria bacterium]
MSGSRRALLLDAMGVIYRVGDDVKDILIPFVREKSGDVEGVEAAYLDASLGRLGPDAFWRSIGLDPSVEDGYLERIELSAGLMGFLPRAAAHVGSIACLSNDIDQWSRKLRRRFALTDAIRTWVISGDVGYRKPSPEIYRIAIGRLGVPAGDIVFVDDRPHNLQAAQAAGMRTLLFDPGATAGTDRTVRTFDELLAVLDYDFRP